MLISIAGTSASPAPRARAAQNDHEGGPSGAMVSFIVRRFLLAILTMWVISALSFVIIQLPPGDFVTTYIAQLSASGGQVSAAEAEALRELYGLNEPFYVQYYKWLVRILVGDFGVSMEWNRPVTEVIGDRLWLTVLISVAALIVTWGLALPIGIYSAVRQYSVADYVFTLVGFIGLAVPNFLLALVIMYLSFRFFGANVGGLFSSEYELAPWSWAKVWDLTKHLPLPAVILALAGTAQLIRIMRANLLDELRRPYVVTARAKGLPEGRVIMKYPVRAALNPFASTIAYLFPYLVSGSVIISIVLSLPTVGPLLVRSLISQDMFLAGTIVLLLGVLTVIGTFISDLVLMWIDPRLRHQMD
jgi:peptide/nickel transport system permease protein